MNRNMGECRLPRKRRSIDPMHTFDSLPAPLRRWLAQAALPWSPTSAECIWTRSLSRGLTQEETLAQLQVAETKTLAREQGLAQVNS